MNTGYSDFVRAIEEHALRAQYRFRARLTHTWRWSEVERASEISPIWCGRKDVLWLNKCTCQEKKWQKQLLWVWILSVKWELKMSPIFSPQNINLAYLFFLL